MKNNIVIGVAVVLVLIVVLGFVLGNQGENYSMFPEFALDATSKPMMPSSSSGAGLMMAATSMKAANPPATINSCKALLRVNELPTAAISPNPWDKGTREFAKQILAMPKAKEDARLMITPANLKNLMAASIREAFVAGQANGFAGTAKMGALVTKQQMNQLKDKASRTRDRDLMSFAERADKLADALNDVSSKLVSRTKPVCYVDQSGNKYPLYNIIEDPNAQMGSFIPAVAKILSGMNNGGNPWFFSKDMLELRKKFNSTKC